MKQPIFVAHRGYSYKWPENTYISFFHASTDPQFLGVEFDVHLTKDNVPVIIHDEKINRTVKGDNQGFIQDFTLSELEEFDFSYGFDVTPQKIMTLKEFCENFATKFKTILLELKTDQIWYENIEEIVFKTIEPYLNVTQWLIQSFNPNCVKKWRKLFGSKTLVGYLVEDEKRFDLNHKDFHLYDFVNPSLETLTNRKAVFLKDQIKTFVWPINTQQMFTDLKDLHQKDGVLLQGFITDCRLWDKEERS